MTSKAPPHIRQRILLLLTLVGLLGLGLSGIIRSALTAAHQATATPAVGQDGIPPYNAPAAATNLPIYQSTIKTTALPASCGSAAPCRPFYGMQFVYQDDLDQAQALGVEVIMTDVRHNGSPADWLAFLDAAQAHNLRVIPWLWPQGWWWDGVTWQIDAQARLFLQTVAGHPAMLAVYALHEPYWNGCEGCGYTTATQQALYTALKAIADVPLYSEISGIAYWTARSPATAFADGVCDYCTVWYSPFRDDGTYEREQVITQLAADLAVGRERAPNSKILWLMPAYEYRPDHKRVPTADEMLDLASIVYDADIDGAWWYPWQFSDHYSDFLANHPELYPVVRQIYDTTVRAAKRPCCTGSLQATFDYGPESITVRDTVWFTSTSTTCCGPLTQAWDWGDGTAPTFAANTAHPYLTAGSYTVTLAITDSLGYAGTRTVSNAVRVSPGTTGTPTGTATATPTGTVSPTPGPAAHNRYVPIIIKR